MFSARLYMHRICVHRGRPADSAKFTDVANQSKYDENNILVVTQNKINNITKNRGTDLSTIVDHYGSICIKFPH